MAGLAPQDLHRADVKRKKFDGNDGFRDGDGFDVGDDNIDNEPASHVCHAIMLSLGHQHKFPSVCPSSNTATAVHISRTRKEEALVWIAFAFMR
jgi:hypothetical protein